MLFIWDGFLFQYRALGSGGFDDKSMFFMDGWTESLLKIVYKYNCKDTKEMNEARKLENPNASGYCFLPFNNVSYFESDDDIIKTQDMIAMTTSVWDSFRKRISAIIEDDRFLLFKDQGWMTYKVVFGHKGNELPITWTLMPFDHFMDMCEVVETHLTEEEQWLVSYKEFINDSEDIHIIN